MAHQNGVTVPRLVDSSFSVASFTVLEAPLQGQHPTLGVEERRSRQQGRRAVRRRRHVSSPCCGTQ